MARLRHLAIAAWPLASLAAAGCTGSGATAPGVEVAGRPESARTSALETGARVMQRDAPTDALGVYLVGFHPMKDNPEHQFEAHHFCRQVNEDFAQCALYDGNTPDANLNGIEYIISERLFESLPEEERQYWHPHNGEILSGQLVGPGLPEIAEKELMRSKMNSYGKTWHTWNTGHGNEGGDILPLGEPALAWSFNRVGEAAPGLVERRDERMGTEERRRQRQDLIEMAHPQEGVDALQDAFERPTEPIPGVVDKGAAAAGVVTGRGTAGEIERERYALKPLRGDFDDLAARGAGDARASPRCARYRPGERALTSRRRRARYRESGRGRALSPRCTDVCAHSRSGGRGPAARSAAASGRCSRSPWPPIPTLRNALVIG